MYEDDPQDKVFDVLGEAVFGDHPLGRRDHRPRAGDRRHAGRRRDRAPSTTRRYVPAQRRDRRGRLGRPRRARRAGVERAGDRARRRPRAARCPRPPDAPARAPCASSRKDTEQYHVCLGAPGPRARRRAPLRAARARHDPRRHVVLAAVPGGAREARPGLLASTRSSRCTPTPARSGCTSARGPTTSPRRCGVVGRRARALPRGARDRRGARARQGERQGPRRAGARVDHRAHEPPRLARCWPTCRC